MRCLANRHKTTFRWPHSKKLLLPHILSWSALFADTHANDHQGFYNLVVFDEAHTSMKLRNPSTAACIRRSQELMAALLERASALVRRILAPMAFACDALWRSFADRGRPRWQLEPKC
jgi:hypothetical protein